MNIPHTSINLKAAANHLDSVAAELAKVYGVTLC